MATNSLIDVSTYQMSGLALLQNLYAYISICNTKFKDFDRIVNNRGATVTFDLPPRFISNPSLVATFQDSAQRTHSLTVDQAENVAYEFTGQEEIFNVDDYVKTFGRSAMTELGAKVEANVALNNLTHTYRFFGDGTTALNSYTQLAEALAFYRNYGAPRHDTKAIIPDLNVPAIVGTGLNQFALDRNNEIANSWFLGDFSNAKWYQSNLLPLHTAGTVGQNASTLTVVSINAAGDQIVCSGAGAGETVLENDLIQFSDGVAGQPNIRYLTFVGHQVSGNPVQSRITVNATEAAGSITLNVFPPLVGPATGGKDQNTSVDVAAGMEITALPNHRAGLIYGGDAMYLAMPRLPDQEPFPTANSVDPDTGVSLRLYYGAKFGMNEKGFVNDVIWGSTLVDEYAMRLVFPE